MSLVVGAVNGVATGGFAAAGAAAAVLVLVVVGVGRLKGGLAEDGGDGGPV